MNLRRMQLKKRGLRLFNASRQFRIPTLFSPAATIARLGTKLAASATGWSDGAAGCSRRGAIIEAEILRAWLRLANRSRRRGSCSAGCPGGNATRCVCAGSKNWSYREIARRLTLSVSAVETLIYRARSNFHRHYESAERNQTPVVLACYKIRESLPPLVAGALGESRRRRVLAHVAQCTRCTQALATLNNAGPVRVAACDSALGWVRTRVVDLLQTLGRSGSQLAAGGAAAGAGVIVATTILTGLASSPAQSAATAGTEQTTPITAVSGREHAASVSDEARLVPPVAESRHQSRRSLLGPQATASTRLMRCLPGRRRLHKLGSRFLAGTLELQKRFQRRSLRACSAAGWG